MEKFAKFFKKTFYRRKLPCLHYVEVHLTDHCNLNCIACTHYSSIASPQFENIQKFNTNMKMLSKKLRFNRIRLLGGEPLLHPNVSDFIKITKKHFPKSHICVCTNAILLPSMSELFWQTCRDCNVTIDITDYPSEKQKEISYYAEIISKNKVAFGGAHNGNKRVVFHNPSGSSNKKISFQRCVIKYKNVILLKGNRIFNCPKTAYIGIYNKYFNKHVAQDKGINIYFNSSKSIKTYISKPTETCKYCSHNYKVIDWTTSKNKDDEWDLT